MSPLPRVLLAAALVAAACAPFLVPGCASQERVDGYAFDREGATARRAAQGELPADLERLAVDHRFGRVVVSDTDGPASWSWHLTCWSDDLGTALAWTERIELRVEVRGREAHLVLDVPPPPAPDLRGVLSNLTVSLPASARVEIENAHGPTRVEGLRGGTHVTARHGTVELADLDGAIDASTTHAALTAQDVAGGRLASEHGPVRVRRVRGALEVETRHAPLEVRDVAGDLRARNAHGLVRARGVDGRADVETSHAPLEVELVRGGAQLVNDRGDVTARDVHGDVEADTSHGTIELVGWSEDVVCRNAHGPIRLELASPDLRSVDASTSHGGIELRVTPGLEARVDAEARHGEVRSDLEPPERGLAAHAARLVLDTDHGDVDIRADAQPLGREL